ncbi:MAG: alpha/beta hydrolase [Robiginitomaculum sp.]|nr:MAG: alpha/beta hydrolase [Robiginitomaculum sp.]
MRILPLILLTSLAACSTQSSVSAQNHVDEKPIIFTANSGQSTDAFEGSFVVPENRLNPQSRDLTLRYVRFAATGTRKGNPIVYLAGGPGGSGIATAKYWRFPFFLAMREFGDVIALDQRGTGASNDMETCTSSHIVDGTQQVSDGEFAKINQRALQECMSIWQGQNIDLRGYTTVQNVGDLEALRVHLGADKINLWGISYGSHMALAAIKQIPDSLERIVIASAEGLDQTIKQPARTDAYFGRLQLAINSQPDAQAQFPDIRAMMHRVHANLDKAPLRIQIPQKNGEAVGYVLQRRDMQQIASAMISDPSRAGQLLQIYSQLDQGNWAPVAGLLQRFYTPGEGVSFSPMSVMTDIASGIGAERRTMIEKQAETSLLGVYLNDTLGLVDVDPSYDLGDGFREKPVSDVPLLLLSGSLDGRTYVESQHEAVSGLHNAQKVLVTNAGHNLFMLSATEVRPGVLDAISDFMQGQNVDGREVAVDLPDF